MAMASWVHFGGGGWDSDSFWAHHVQEPIQVKCHNPESCHDSGAGYAKSKNFRFERIIKKKIIPDPPLLSALLAIYYSSHIIP